METNHSSTFNASFQKCRLLFKNMRQQLYIDIDKDYRNSLFLAGTGRSGTTWVEDIINYKNEYRLMFEPFHSRRVKILKDFKYRQYLRESNTDEKYLVPAARILCGNVRNPWIDIINRRVICRQRLIKDIRAHLLLRWIHVNFKGIPIILLLRHPCAVAASKLKMKWDTHLDEFLAQDELMEDFLNPFKKEIENAKDAFDEHMFTWCIENYVPLKQFSKGEILIVFYEQFCLQPIKEIEKMFVFLGKSYDANFTDVIQKPSSETLETSAIMQGGDLTGSWRGEISDDQLKRAVEILQIFGLDKIYSKGFLPDLNGADSYLNEELAGKE